MYIGDEYNHRVRKLTVSTGIITTIAGTGDTSYKGNGGAATSATLNRPEGLALDSSNNLYIADYGNDRIRKVVKSTGIISSIAGSTGCSSSIGDDDQATSASLCGPNGVVLDSSGNIYITDTFNCRIRKIGASNGIISTIAGGSSSYDDYVAATSTALVKPWSITLDSSDNIYITDIGAQLIRKIMSSSGIIITIAGIYDNRGYSGDYIAATSSALNLPSSVALDANGNFYIADKGNNLVRFVNVSSGIMSNEIGNFYEDDIYYSGDDDSHANNGDDDGNNGDDDGVDDTGSLILGLILGLFLPLGVIYGCCRKFCTSNNNNNNTVYAESSPAPKEPSVPKPSIPVPSVPKTEIIYSKYKTGKCCVCAVERESYLCKIGHFTCFECLLFSGIISYEQGTNNGLNIMCPGVMGNINCNQHCEISNNFIPQYHCGILSKQYNRVLQQTNVKSRLVFSSEIKKIEWREISSPITLIGQGAFSYVFKAVYNKNDVAIKLLKKSTLNNQNYITGECTTECR